MKYKEYVIDGHRIKYTNTILGKETVTLNKELISSKRSLFGTSHSFELCNKHYILLTKREFIDNLEVSLELYKNGELVEENKVKDKSLVLILILSGILVLSLMSFFVV